MKHSRDHILTSHAGSLPRPDDVIEANRARESGQASDERRFQAQLRSSVADVVSRQKLGKERVIASTDCGLGGRVHPQIAWAKLESLAHGAALATRRLWR
jgi:methionine synthase II (cobalamin-independent)